MTACLPRASGPVRLSVRRTEPVQSLIDFVITVVTIVIAPTQCISMFMIGDHSPLLPVQNGSKIGCGVAKEVSIFRGTYYHPSEHNKSNTSCAAWVEKNFDVRGTYYHMRNCNTTRRKPTWRRQVPIVRSTCPSALMCAPVVMTIFLASRSRYGSPDIASAETVK